MLLLVYRLIIGLIEIFYVFFFMELPCFFFFFCLRMHDKNITHENDVVAPLRLPEVVKVTNSPSKANDSDT